MENMVFLFGSFSLEKETQFKIEEQKERFIKDKMLI